MDTITKRYLGMGEVVAEIPVSTFCIHNWCKWFDIHPRRDGHQNRRFTQEQFMRLRLIYVLLRVERYSVAGAKIELGLKPKLK